MTNLQEHSLETAAANGRATSPTLVLRLDDLQKSLNRSHIDMSLLSTFQRILLTSDGAITNALEAYQLEEIQTVKLSDELVPLAHDIPAMDVKAGAKAIIRKVLLQGKISRKNFVYASSITIYERLSERFRNVLLETKMPIGKLWFEEGVETLKEVVDYGKGPADDLAKYFNVQPADNMLSRTYRVVNNRKPVVMVTQMFPDSYFLKSC
ncbi:MAG: DUF98 domain-containing protein [Aphanocapsa sp. GSE-SYN-MK-11-07L]|jgi:chorismate-pyruvate lyase|nr:DUF98 domain-containing protein [Aphanocapsa sp. GSE-SYN-MK-11-07L]